jgi:GH35 family endo-1,4-beta-xylanase
VKNYRRPAPDLCLEYCKEHGIEPKLHCLVYDQWSPKWLPEDAQEIKRLLDQRIAQIAERYRDEIPSMEVINETQCSYVTGKDDRKSTPFFLEPDIIEWSFDHARKYLPANKPIINEATGHVWGNRYKYTRSAYYLQIQRALEKGATIDSIGFQYHQFHKREDEAGQATFLLDPKRLYEVMDTYARLNLPMQVTEVTASAYSWEEEDEYVQAEMLRNLYRIWFSHPNMEAIVYWNMVDGYAAYAKPGDMTNGENKYHGGLLRFDMSKKPAWEVLDQLINHDWHTSQQLSCSGTAEVKGFYGTYTLTATANGKEVTKTIHLKKGNPNQFTVVL